MTGPVYQVGAVAMCPHGAPITAISADARVLASGTPVALLTDQFLVAGCAFSTPALGPQPCIKVQWLVGTVRSLVTGQPAVTAVSSGLCIAANGMVNGPAIITTTQPRVIAS